MLRKLFVLGATALLIGACQQPEPAAAPPPPPPAPKSFMVFFDLDSATLSAQARDTLRQAATAYKSGSGGGVSVTGHTDTTGPADYNMALSLRRANSTKAGLVQETIPASVI